MKQCLWIIGGLLVAVTVTAVGLFWGLTTAEAGATESISSAPRQTLTLSEHTPAAEPHLVDDPVRGFCGNTFATIITADGTYSITSGDAVELTALAINTAYDKDAVCNCLAPVRVITELDSETFELNPDSAFIRCSRGQAPLTAEQVELVRGVLSRLRDEDRVQ